MFSNKPPSIVNEVYYRSCEKMLKLQRITSKDDFDRACEICYDNKIYKADSLKSIIVTVVKSINTDISDEQQSIKITNKENTRGGKFYK